MTLKRLGAVGCVVFAGLVLATSTGAQDVAAPPDSAPQFSQARLDQMLAPIALYPDELLGEVAMAAGYPLEVVDADRQISAYDPDRSWRIVYASAPRR